MTLKHYVAALLLLWAGGEAAARKVRTVTVDVPGTLPALIAPTEKYTLTAIALRGTLNGTDLRFLREMAGSDYQQNPTPGRLTDIDLRGVTFAASGLPYVNKEGDYRPTGRYTLPRFLFRRTRLAHIVLPERLDTIATGALEYTQLRRISLPENVYVADWAFNQNPQLESVTFPSYLPAVLPCTFSGCPKLTELSFNHVGYVSAHALLGLPAVRRITFGGAIGHIDGWQTIAQCPQLERVEFRGAVLSTGGPTLFADNPELTEVTFRGPVAGSELGPAENCPKLKSYRLLGAADDDLPDCFVREWPADSAARAEMTRTAWAQCAPMVSYLQNGPNGLRISYTLLQWGYRYAVDQTAAGRPEQAVAALEAVLPETGMTGRDLMDIDTLAPLHGRADFKDLVDRLDARSDYRTVLQQSAPYTQNAAFTYAPPTDSGLQRVAAYFNVDSIAGRGDELSRIKNVMYWVHDHIRHDGASSWPTCRRNAIDLYRTTVEEKRGLNCRFLAEVLNEMYLSIGIPSRFITCQSRRYDTDTDCHVLNMVWSRTLNKWVWMDPSFAAYVTDENGVLLHQGEVRERLIKGLPLTLNADANWNHKSPQTKEHYLETYMAKNLYLMSTWLHNGYETEQPEQMQQNTDVVLTPQGFNYRWGGRLTSDDAYFWQAPPEAAR